MDITPLPVSDWLSREDAARYLGVSVNTLATWATGRGPGLPFAKISRRMVRYSKSDLDAFLRDRVVTHTGQQPAPVVA